MLASGLDKFANGFERLASGLDRFAKGFDKFAIRFLSIFKTGLVRFLIELFCEKPVIPEVLELALSPKAWAELEIN
jgi:X-X-X-Leu-X-X-Gly heptad repeat protein